jgi:dTDP-glucose 4,6-dehydratase
MDWTGRKVLVTGAGGFIGSHLVERLVALGASVRAMVHYNALGSWGWLDSSPVRKDVEVVAGDIADRDSVDASVKGMDVVLHLGALIAIPYSYAAPESYVRINVQGTLNMLLAARAHGTARLVHTSTSEVYGTARFVPIGEDHPLQGQSPYSATKIAADKMVEAFHASFGVPAVTLRPFNTYGPRQSARAIIPTIITQALAGETIRLGNLHPTRDLTFVSDTVEGFIRAASVDAAIGQTLNLGTGREISIGDLVRRIVERMGLEVKVEVADERLRPAASEVERLLSDNRKAREVLAWEPCVALDDGLDRTIAFLKRNLDRYRTDRFVV